MGFQLPFGNLPCAQGEGNQGPGRNTSTQHKQDQPWAAPVANWKVETGEDSLDYPAIWVWVFLATNQQSELETSQEEFDKLDAIRKQVCGRIAKSGDDRWVYVRFRTKAGQVELEELGSARKPLKNLRRCQHETCR